MSISASAGFQPSDIATQAHSQGRVGPNAITRVAEALGTLEAAGIRERVFAHAGLLHHLSNPPGQMVDEREVGRLHASLYAVLGDEVARRVAREAGRLTGDYLIAHRIPKIVGVVLRLLPSGPAGRLLVSAITRHAWTFAGSGQFSASFSPVLTLTISGCPICRDMTADSPVCDYYVATFERLFQVLVSRRARVRETACAASGAPECIFEVRY